MNISEALKLLQDGKKIYHKNSPHIIYHLIDGSLKSYSKFVDDECYGFGTESRNEFTIDCKHDLEGWEERIEPIAITFYIAKEFYKAGKQIRRIGEKEWFSKYDLYPMAVTVEDIEGNDWEVI
jgi:hypothetical protein